MNRFWSPRRLVRGAGEDSETAAATGSGRHLRAFLIVLLVLSFAPVPTTGDALATDRPASRPRPVPPANAVRLLERQHAAGTTERRPAATATRPKAQRNAKQRRAQRHEARGNPKPRARKRAERIHVKGCLFKVRKRTWTLARNCAPRGTIVVPNGFTLNGKNRTMVVTGNAAKFQGAVVASGFGSGRVVNLRIEGNAGLTGSCRDLSSGIFFYNSDGTIRNVTVRNIEVGGSDCDSGGGIALGGGIVVHGTTFVMVNILNSTVHNAGRVAISLDRLFKSTVAGNNVLIAAHSGFGSGIVMVNSQRVVVRHNDFRLGDGDTTAEGLVVGCELLPDVAFPTGLILIAGNRFHEGMSAGIYVIACGGAVVVRDNVLADVLNRGIDVWDGEFLILRNTVIGTTSVPEPARFGFGLGVGFDVRGVANNNAFSNFTCGVRFFPDAALELGSGPDANTFDNNETDVCRNP